MTSTVDRRRRSERARMEMELLKAVVTLSVPRFEIPAEADVALDNDRGHPGERDGRSPTLVGKLLRRIGGLFAARQPGGGAGQ